jgi:hypothetical protein
VFTEARKRTLQTNLETSGYRCFFPVDDIQSILPSGLCIALRTSSLWSHQSTRFTPFFNYIYADIFANKGFFKITLQHVTGMQINIINTHMQSDIELSYLKGSSKTSNIRKQQLHQIVQEYGQSKVPTFIVGDLNQEGMIHPSVKNICCNHGDAISTFPPTGENLDHMAWIVGTGISPRLHSIHIGDEVSWSDHSPLLCTFKLPIA